MKVALSASYYLSPPVLEILKSCDVVYTTQHEHIKDIEKLCPGVTVLPLPDQRPDMVEFLRKRHEDDEVFDYHDLVKASGVAEFISKPTAIS